MASACSNTNTIAIDSLPLTQGSKSPSLATPSPESSSLPNSADSSRPHSQYSNLTNASGSPSEIEKLSNSDETRCPSSQTPPPPDPEPNSPDPCSPPAHNAQHTMLPSTSNVSSNHSSQPVDSSPYQSLLTRISWSGWCQATIGIIGLALTTLALRYCIRSDRMARWQMDNDELQACLGFAQANMILSRRCQERIGSNVREPLYHVGKRALRAALNMTTQFTKRDLVSLPNDDATIHPHRRYRADPLSLRSSIFIVTVVLILGTLTLIIMRKTSRQGNDRTSDHRQVVCAALGIACLCWALVGTVSLHKAVCTNESIGFFAFTNYLSYASNILVAWTAATYFLHRSLRRPSPPPQPALPTRYDYQITHHHSAGPETFTWQASTYVRHDPSSSQYPTTLRRSIQEGESDAASTEQHRPSWHRFNSSTSTLVNPYAGPNPSRVSISCESANEKHEGLIELETTNDSKTFFDPDTGKFIHLTPWRSGADSSSHDQTTKGAQEGSVKRAIAKMFPGGVALAGGKRIGEAVKTTTNEAAGGGAEEKKPSVGWGKTTALDEGSKEGERTRKGYTVGDAIGGHVAGDSGGAWPQMA